MVQITHNPWLSRFAAVTAAATLFLICVGGLVTSHGVGMSVPDWPTTYGYNMFFFPFSQWVGGIFYEHSHRLVASVVGLLTAVLAGWIWARENRGTPRWVGLAAIVATLGLMGVRTQWMFVTLAAVATGVTVFSFLRLGSDERPIRWWAAIAFSVVLIQGVLGGLRVTAIKDELGIFHGTLAQLFFVLVSALSLVTSKWWQQGRPGNLPVYDRSGLRYFYALATGMILLQLILGATMRHQHAGLAIPDFPLAYGQVWPATDTDSVARYNQLRSEATALNPITAPQVVLQMTHRIVAAAIFVVVLWTVRRTYRTLGWSSRLTKLSTVWLGLILLQVALGAFTIWTNKSADIATAHVAVGALSLVTGSLLALMAYRWFEKSPATAAETAPRPARSGNPVKSPA